MMMMIRVKKMMMLTCKRAGCLRWIERQRTQETPLVVLKTSTMVNMVWIMLIIIVGIFFEVSIYC